MRLRRIILFLALTIAGGQAEAVVATGKISSIFLSSSTNYAFRVVLNPPIQGCSGGFAYVNVADHGNYQAYVSSLTSAYLAGKTVDITYGSVQGGYCLISEFQVRG